MASFIQEGVFFWNDCEENCTYHLLSFGLDAYMLPYLVFTVTWPKGAGGIIYIL